MLAGMSINKFISIAGFGQSADKVLKEQLSSQPKVVQDLSFPIIDSLKHGNTIETVPPMLNSLFRPSVQPYMISWFKYDPQDEIKKLSIPLITGMNHILRITDGDRQANLTTYSNSNLPIAEELVKAITDFIRRNTNIDN